MIASLPLSDPMVPEHDDFRKLLTATSELHKLDFRRQVRCAVAMRCDAMHPLRLCYVVLAPAVQWHTGRTAVVRRSALRLPCCGAALAYRR